MYSFRSDYEEFCNDEILDELKRINHHQRVGYGEDDYCNEVRDLIRKFIGVADIDVHYMVGGTPCNLTLIAHALRPYEAVIAASTGHINVHETGAIEETGHKILVAKSINGKIYPEAIKEVLDKHTDHHMVLPKLIFISNSTEYGTIYTKEELINLYNFAHEHDLYLYLDGARLMSALNASDNDLSIKDICTYTDAFYIGGTKNGAMLGEVMIISNNELKKNFKYSWKQQGSLLAKNSLIAAQFKVLIETDLINKNSLHANKMAKLLKDAFVSKGYELDYENNTNQLFVKMSEDTFNRLQQYASFQIMDKEKDYILARFVTSFNTKEDEVLKFIENI